MSKQDRQGSRTPAELERKHSKVLSGKDDTNAVQNRQIEQLAQSMQGNTSVFNHSITLLNARLSKVEESVANLEGDDSTTLLSERVGNAEQRITDLEEADANQVSTITSLVQSLSRMETTVSGLDTRLTTVENTLSSLDARVTALEG